MTQESIFTRKAVFISKEGTLIAHGGDHDRSDIDPERIRFLPGVIKGLSLLHEAGFDIFVLSNQPGVALGQYTERDIKKAEVRIRELMRRVSIPLAGFYFCPHHPHGSIPAYSRECLCRKPSPGLILDAARTHGIQLAQSWVIGDTLNDIESAHRAGCKTILIDNGHETDWSIAWHRKPDYMATDLVEAALMARAAGTHHPQGAIA